MAAAWATADSGKLTVAADAATLLLTAKSGRAVRLAGLPAGGSPAAGGATCKPAAATDGRATFDVAFGAGARAARATLICHADGAVTIRPGPKLAGLTVETPMAYAVVPGRRVGQTICPADRYAPGREVHLPPENLLVALTPGGDSMVVLAWPTGRQRVSVVRDSRRGPGARFSSARVTLGGGELHLAIFEAKGIWHGLRLRKEHLEKDIDLGWDRPFRAQWVTQLRQTGVPTTFEFVHGRRREWSPDLGSFTWPARFEGRRGFLMLGKKLPPVGEAVIFPLAEHPATPFGFLRRMLSPARRREVTELGPTRAGYDLVRRPPHVWSYHCAGERRLRDTLLAAGLHYRERTLMVSHIAERVAEDLCVARMAQRDLDFLDALAAQLDAWPAEAKRDAATLAALKELARGGAAVRAVYDRLMKGSTPKQYEAHIQATAEAFRQAVRRPEAEHRGELVSLLDAMNEPKNRVESFGKDFGGAVRQYYHDVARICADTPAAMPYGLAVREAIRQVLEVRQFEAPGRYWKDLR